MLTENSPVLDCCQGRDAKTAYGRAREEVSRDKEGRPGSTRSRKTKPKMILSSSTTLNNLRARVRCQWRILPSLMDRSLFRKVSRVW